MHKPELAALIAQDFLIVKIDVGRYDKNLDVAGKYRAPIKRGIPTLVVLDPHGKVLYAMEHGQFAHARHVSYESIEAFFEEWKPKTSRK